MLAGMMARPRAISLRTSSGSIFSRLATENISSLTTPLRARCFWDMFFELLAWAWSPSRFSIQVSRSGISPPRGVASDEWRAVSKEAGRSRTLARGKRDYRIGWGERQLGQGQL